MAEVAGSNPAEPIFFFDLGAGIVSDDEEGKQEKLPTDEELPTSADGDEERKEEQSGDYVVEVPGGIICYSRGPDGKLSSHEFSTEELIPDEGEALSDEDLRTGERVKSVDLDTLIAIRDILEVDKEPIHVPDFNGAGIEKPHAIPASADVKLHFSQSDLQRFVEHRKAGLAIKSLDWITRASTALWESTGGEVSQTSMTALRTFTLTKYSSVTSHSKVLGFAAGFLRFLAKTKMEPRYASFEAYLEMPKAVKERKSITSRIVTKGDIENVLRHIKQAEKNGTLNAQRSAQYSAFVIFGAFTGQRSMSTIANLTVGKFREALRSEKPVLHVESSQDKIRMEHYVPLHPQVVSAIEAILDDRKDEDRMFGYNSFQMWMKRHPVPMSRFKGHFELSDLRKFAEQQGDIIEWEHSNRAYVLTHGVSGVDWTHYKHPLPDSVYDVYMKYWGNISLDI
jgi:integrase